MNEAEAILMALRVWVITGAVVAAVFLTIGMDRIDEDAQGAYVFRPLLIPGVLVIWPLVLWRWYIYESNREVWAKRYDPPRRSHYPVGIILPLGILLVILAGFTVRQTWPSDIAPQRLAAPAEVDQ